MDFPGGSDGKASVYNVGDLGSIPGSGRSPGEGNGKPLQYSCLENPMDGGAWCRIVSLGSQRVGHNWATSLSFFKGWCYQDVAFNVSKSGRPSSGQRTGKGQSSSQFPRRVVPKNVLIIGQLHSFPMLVRSCLKPCMLGLSIMWNKNFQMSKLGFRKGRETRDKCQHSLDHRES